MTAFDTDPAPARPRRLRKLVLPALLLVSFSPAAPAEDISARKAQAARAFIERTSLTGLIGQSGGKVAINPDWEEFDALVSLTGHMLDRPNVATRQEDGTVTLVASHRLPMGLWINAEADARSAEDGSTRYSAWVGRIPLGHDALGMAYGIVRKVWHPRGVQLPEWSSLESDVDIRPGGVTARIDPRQFAAFWQLPDIGRTLGARSKLALDQYCEFVELRRAAPTRSLADMVNMAFSSTTGREHPDTALIALAMMARAPQIEYLTGDGNPDPSECGIVPALRLGGRMDLAKHWTVSAALAASVDADAGAIGEWKEVADSDAGGSGFSYLDLAADMSGAYVGNALRAPEQRAAAISLLAQVRDEDLFPVGDLPLEEDLSEAQFLSEFGGLDGARHKAVTREINDAIKRRLTLAMAAQEAS